MAVTDTLDSLLVFKLCSRAGARVTRATRLWLAGVTGLALAVAVYELAQLLGWRSPVPDIGVSAILVASLLAVFAWSYRWAGRDDAHATSSPAVDGAVRPTAFLEATP